MNEERAEMLHRFETDEISLIEVADAIRLALRTVRGVKEKHFHTKQAAASCDWVIENLASALEAIPEQIDEEG